MFVIVTLYTIRHSETHCSQCSYNNAYRHPFVSLRPLHVVLSLVLDIHGDTFSIDEGITDVSGGIIRLIQRVVYGDRPRAPAVGHFVVGVGDGVCGSRRVSRHYTTDVPRLMYLKLPQLKRRLRASPGQPFLLSRAIAKFSSSSYEEEAWSLRDQYSGEFITKYGEIFEVFLDLCSLSAIFV